MHIVLTNDDGYDAPGLAALWQAVSVMADVQISVIAPAQAFSGKGHAISPAVLCRQVEMDGMGSITVVEGTPGDCARMAVALPDQPRPDWVISGINHGSNLGIDVFYSGTVAAAREAVLLGIPAIAISQMTRGGIEDDWPRTMAEAAAVLAAVIRPAAGAPKGADAWVFEQARQVLGGSPQPASNDKAFWNINLPRLPKGQPAAGVELTPVSTDPLIIAYRHEPASGGAAQLQYVGKYHDRPATPGSDVAATFSGIISISRVTV